MSVTDDRAGRRHQIELAVFMLLLAPAIALAQVLGASRETFVIASLATMLHDLGFTALVAFFVWSGGEPLAAIGWGRRRVGREVTLGVLLYPAMLGLIGLLAALLRASGIERTGAPPGFLQPRTPGETVLACVLVLIVAGAEETIFRGYLLLRLRELTRSTTIAVAIATLVFASGHTYEGIGGVIAVAVMGVVLALVYLWRRSLIAPVVLHFLQDFLGLVIVPWLSRYH
jgi:membrane protease YdiL (CAAX protease family)